MILEFDRLARQSPYETCFTFIEKEGHAQDYTYTDVRLRAAALASKLQDKGLRRGDYVSVDMDNCPAFLITVLAAGYAGFSLVILNHRLTDDEKTERLTELRMIRDFHIATHLDEAKVERMLDQADVFKDQDAPSQRGLFGKKAARKQTLDAFTSTLAYRELIHLAERNAALLDETKSAVVLFTSGTSGRPKAVSLSWKNLCGAAAASNAVLNTPGKGVWQAALPLFHIGGLEIVVRSILNETPFLLYRHFDPKKILEDAEAFKATHISVVDKMLQDMLSTSEASGGLGLIKQYDCILLGGAALNPVTLERAIAQNARLYASYGMTETSSQIASRQVTENFDGGLDLLPGYEAHAITSDENDVGQLAVRGPGVFSAYLNAKAPFTVDGFFLTGDQASFSRGRLFVQERLSDMFVSGGENIYPAEIEEKLLRIPGVSAASVFGVEDGTWGRRPVAFVERESLTTEPSSSPQSFSQEVRESMQRRLAKIYWPQHICVLDEFPRLGVGKVDTERLRQRYNERLEIREIRVYRIKQKLTKAFITSKTVMRFRESVIIEIVDGAGRIGLGECVAFPTDWYLPETLDQDIRVLEEVLIPLVLQQVYLHPREVSACFDECEEAQAFPLARGALEPAFWDLYGKIVGKPLGELLKEEVGVASRENPAQSRASHQEKVSQQDSASPQEIVSQQNRALQQDSAQQRDDSTTTSVKVPGGMVVGIMPIAKTLETVRAAVEAGYTRVKIKVKPGDDIERVRAVRKEFPDIMLMLDANQSYTERDIETLKELDALNICCIEEPFDPVRTPEVGPTDLMARLARLQKNLKAAICLDESIFSYDDAEKALSTSGITCYALKIAKWGGITKALEFYRKTQEKNIDVWMGGMYETGVSKLMHAAFETLPGITLPGDLSSTTRYFMTEIITPAFEVSDGSITLNPPGFETGLGCELDQDMIEKVLVDKHIFVQSEKGSQ